MNMRQKVQVFTEKYPFLGPAIWILCVHYFVTQILVAWAWKTPYSIAKNPISDLGNTACGEFAGRYVCSPHHSWMNASFIALGILMAIGSLLLYQGFRKNSAVFTGFLFLAIGGFGTILVGLFPENTISQLHFLGALLPFLLGNIAMLLIGVYSDIRGKLRIYTLLSAGIALTALVFFLTHHYLGLGEGGLERVVAYPLTVWLIVMGVYTSRSE